MSGMPLYSGLQHLGCHSIVNFTSELVLGSIVAARHYPHMSNASSLLSDYLSQLGRAATLGPILDLACGRGRNGLYLLDKGIPVVFADINADALEAVRQALQARATPDQIELAELRIEDFESNTSRALDTQRFGGVMVFRYLHRPLMHKIQYAIKPGGLIVYETFTVEQPQYGRPSNPDYLLRQGELEEFFQDWQILYSFEGTTQAGQGHGPAAIAQIIAVKPENQ